MALLNRPARWGQLVSRASLLLTSLLVGCATSDHFYLGARTVKCVPFKNPIEFLSEPPSRPYRELAHVEAGQLLFFWKRWEALRSAMCQRAVLIGADAVILAKLGDHPYDLGIATFGLAGRNKRLTGIAIVYDDDGVAPEAPEAEDATDAADERFER